MKTFRSFITEAAAFPSDHTSSKIGNHIKKHFGGSGAQSDGNNPHSGLKQHVTSVSSNSHKKNLGKHLEKHGFKKETLAANPHRGSASVYSHASGTKIKIHDDSKAVSITTINKKLKRSNLPYYD
jgi:hypothetical protein